LTFAT